MRILISHCKRNLCGFHGGSPEQFLCFLHTHLGQKLNKSLTHLLAEDGTEMTGT